MRYGNRYGDLWKVILLGFAIGCIAVSISFLLGKSVQPGRGVWLAFVVFAAPVALGVAVLPTVLFSIHVDGEYVEQRFLDRVILSREKTCDYIEMRRPSFPFAAILTFRSGKRIRIFGMHIGALKSLDKELNVYTEPVAGGDATR